MSEIDYVVFKRKLGSRCVYVTVMELVLKTRRAVGAAECRYCKVAVFSTVDCGKYIRTKFIYIITLASFKMIIYTILRAHITILMFFSWFHFSVWLSKVFVCTDGSNRRCNLSKDLEKIT